MLDTLRCAAWTITLPEPAVAAFPNRLKVQEDYLSSEFVPWFLDEPPSWLERCHSFHFMRYIDAGHGEHGGISVELRLLGTPDILAEAAPNVERTLSSQQASGTIVNYQPKTVADWIVIDACGGSALNEPFAHFLASSSRLALELVRTPRRDFTARDAIIRNWVHCVRLIARGMG